MRSSIDGSASPRPGSTESAASVPSARPGWVGEVRSSVSGTGRTSKWPTERQVCMCESASTTCSTPAASPPCFMISTVACRRVACGASRVARRVWRVACVRHDAVAACITGALHSVYGTVHCIA